MRSRWFSIVVSSVCLALAPLAASAHLTPPVTVKSERDVLADASRGAAKLTARQMRLTAAERDAIARETGWRPKDKVQRLFIGRDGDGKAVSAVAFVSEITIHGPIRVAVAVGADGKVTNAAVVEMTEETYPAFKPLLDKGFSPIAALDPTKLIEGQDEIDLRLDIGRVTIGDSPPDGQGLLVGGDRGRAIAIGRPLDEKYNSVLRGAKWTRSCRRAPQLWWATGSRVLPYARGSVVTRKCRNLRLERSAHSFQQSACESERMFVRSLTSPEGTPVRC